MLVCFASFAEDHAKSSGGLKENRFAGAFMSETLPYQRWIQCPECESSEVLVERGVDEMGAVEWLEVNCTDCGEETLVRP